MSQQKQARCNKIAIWLCGDRDETISQIISECRKLVQKEYKTRHNLLRKLIHWELCKKFKFDHKNKWYCHVIAHGDEEVRPILFSRGESALSSSQKVTVKRECESRRGDQVFALSDLRSPDIGRGKREKPNDWLGPQNGSGAPFPSAEVNSKKSVFEQGS